MSSFDYDHEMRIGHVPCVKCGHTVTVSVLPGQTIETVAQNAVCSRCEKLRGEEDRIGD